MIGMLMGVLLKTLKLEKLVNVIPKILNDLILECEWFWLGFNEELLSFPNLGRGLNIR
jgi:hypothetical protein